jgi:Family of unknown function (DUF5682)
LEVFGIRHHGPGSARSLVAALDGFGPDLVLIEGPADADPLLAWAASDQTVPPVALLAYVVDQPHRAAFWPFAVFSPEWQAVRWAADHDVGVAFCDLPAAVVLAGGETQPTLPEADPDAAGQESDPVLTDTGRAVREDPLARLAAAAGYDDPERWWDDVVESRPSRAGEQGSPFAALLEAMAELRADHPSVDPAEARREARREAFMRQTIRAAGKAGRRRVAVVCGAWHAPVLTRPLPPAATDARLLRGLPRRKVRTTWVPWTHSRLAYASGYGAGITSPGWYSHLWSAPDQPVTRWLTKVAGALRTKDLPVSSAHVIESVRLAETLAIVRGRPLAGLSEVQDATRAVMCDGSEVMLDFITAELVVGQALGSVDPAVPTVPLEADLLRQCRSLRVKREATPRFHDLDLRKPTDRARSVLFHRLRVLDLDWIRPAETEIQGRGTFRETWRSQWRPEHALALVEAATWGTTVAGAASARVLDRSVRAGLVEQTEAVERCLLADLPEALSALLAGLSRQAALDADVVHLMEALPALARAQRYGDVRDTDTSALASVSETLVVRICANLKPALTGLDTASAGSMRRRIDQVHAAVGLLPETGGGCSPSSLQRWLDTLAGLLDFPGGHPEIAGRVLRILFDAERLPDVRDRLQRALSYGAPAAAKAAWIDGFFADGALLVIHDAELRALLDGWLSELSADDFVDVLPLVRRTFGTFTPPERRLIAERLRQRPDDERSAGTEPSGDLELELAAPALATIDAILAAPRADRFPS